MTLKKNLKIKLADRIKDNSNIRSQNNTKLKCESNNIILIDLTFLLFDFLRYSH